MSVGMINYHRAKQVTVENRDYSPQEGCYGFSATVVRITSEHGDETSVTIFGERGRYWIPATDPHRDYADVGRIIDEVTA